MTQITFTLFSDLKGNICYTSLNGEAAPVSGTLKPNPRISASMLAEIVLGKNATEVDVHNPRLRADLPEGFQDNRYCLLAPANGEITIDFLRGMLPNTTRINYDLD